MADVFPLLMALEELIEKYRVEGNTQYARSRKKRSMADSCSCRSCPPTTPQTDMLGLLGELREKLDREEVEAAGHRAFPSQALSPFRPTGNSEQWKELMKNVG
jgi:hypothetical protein